MAISFLEVVAWLGSCIMENDRFGLALFAMLYP